jgi:hypothetical protein
LFSKDLLKSANFKPAIMDGHGTEQRVITQFTEALAENNEAAFRRIVSTRFEKKAMRSKDAYKDLEILSLPKSKLEVAESKETEGGGFETVAKEEKGTTKYQFMIVRDPEKRRWVVDDVLLRQQKKGTRASKSSVEVMDLLLTVREFLDTWQGADRATVLNAVSSELREPLEQLPEPWLQRMIARVSAEYETGMARRPEAQMNESDAVVKMPSKNGFLLMKVVRQNDHWLVSDIEVRNRKVQDHPGSILRQTRAMNAVTAFLGAYADNDLVRLEKLTEEKFYHSALRIGDLSMIQLPLPSHAPEDFEIQSFAGQLTIMIPDQSKVVRLDLTTPELARARDDRKPSAAVIESSFIIADITIYDRQTQQQQNLKSAFTAPARALLFLTALQTRDLPVLNQISTQQMSEETWSRIKPSLIDDLPLSEVPSGEMTLQSSKVRGNMTEMDFQSSAGRICSVIMRNENGSLKVEDVQYPDHSGQVASLKTDLMLTVPVIELARAWQAGDLEGVKRNSSMDFNRLVWSNLADLPSQLDHLPTLLLMPLEKVQSGEQRAMVELATPGQPPLQVVLLKEKSAWVVDEISLQQNDGNRFELRKSLRQEIAQQFLIDPTGGIRQAAYENSSPKSASGVVLANGLSSDKPRGNLTLPSSGRPTVRPAVMSAEVPKSRTPAIPANSTDSHVSDNATLRFGPGPGAVPGNSMYADDADVPPRIRPRSAEQVEHEGVVYFKGADVPSSESLKTNDPAQKSPAVIDPSQNPIEIPLE